jgi:hypothetical protein
MVTRTTDSLGSTHTVWQHAYYHLNCAAYWVDKLSMVQQPGCGLSLAVCCSELTEHKYRHRSDTLSLLPCGTSHLVFLTFCSVSVSVITHQVSSYILVRLRFACFDYEHELAVRDLQVTCWNEVGISTGYKHEKIYRLCRETAASFYMNISLTFWYRNFRFKFKHILYVKCE